ncbi:30537_t:CDS:2, partial [Racocetra persica]
MASTSDKKILTDNYLKWHAKLTLPAILTDKKNYSRLYKRYKEETGEDPWQYIDSPGSSQIEDSKNETEVLEQNPGISLSHSTDSDDIYRCNTSLCPSSVNIQNKSHSDSSDISRAELDSIIKSQLALVSTTSIQSSQLQKTQALQSQQKQTDFSDYLRVLDKYISERLPDG